MMPSDLELAREYLTRTLGDRSGCDVLSPLDRDIADEIVEELAALLERVRGEAERDARLYENRVRSVQQPWRWMGTPEDDPDSMGEDMAVLITGGELRRYRDRVRQDAQLQRDNVAMMLGKVLHKVRKTVPSELASQAIDLMDRMGCGPSILRVRDQSLEQKETE